MNDSTILNSDGITINVRNTESIKINRQGGNDGGKNSLSINEHTVKIEEQ